MARNKSAAKSAPKEPKKSAAKAPKKSAAKVSKKPAAKVPSRPRVPSSAQPHAGSSEQAHAGHSEETHAQGNDKTVGHSISSYSQPGPSSVGDLWQGLDAIDQPVDKGASPGPRSGCGKKRARESSSVTKAMRVFDDTTAERRAKAYLFTARVDVAVLDPNWGAGHGANRSLDRSHIISLQQAFQDTGIKRVEVECRIKASIDLATARLVEESLIDDEELKLLKSGRTATSVKDVLYIAWGQSWPRPILDAGQHRRAALLTILGVDPEVTRSPDQVLEKSWWTVDFYNRDLLAADVLTQSTLRANTVSVYRKGSDGDHFSFFIHTWTNITEVERQQYSRSAQTLRDFVGMLVGSDANALERYLPIIQHKPLFNAITQFIAIPWGRSKFSTGNAYKIIGVHINFILVARWKEFTDFFRDAYGDAASLVSPEDVEAIDRLGIPKRSNTLSQLFFPRPDHFHSEKTRLPWYVSYKLDTKPTAEEIENTWPRLTVQSPEMDDDDDEMTDESWYRRPGFLTRLSDKAYCDLYTRLLSGRICELTLPPWDQFNSGECAKIGPAVSAIIHHMVFWFMPGFEKPSTTSRDVAKFQWIKVVQEEIIRHRKSTYTKPPNEIVDTLRAAKAMIRDVWGLVANNYTVITNAAIKSWIDPPKTGPGPEEAREYNRRFTNPLWNKIILLAYDYTGGNFSEDSAVVGFKKRQAILVARRPWTLWGYNIAATQFSTNPEMRQIKALYTPRNRQDLQLEAALFGSRWEYVRLKKLLINHCRHPEAAATAITDSNHVLDSKELALLKDQLVEYAGFLNDAGFEVKPLDLNEELGRVVPSFGYKPNPRFGMDDEEPEEESDVGIISSDDGLEPLVGRTVEPTTPTPKRGGTRTLLELSADKTARQLFPPRTGGIRDKRESLFDRTMELTTPGSGRNKGKNRAEQEGEDGRSTGGLELQLDEELQQLIRGQEANNKEKIGEEEEIEEEEEEEEAEKELEPEREEEATKDVESEEERETQ